MSSDASRTFAALMAKARAGKLTERDRVQLSHARQQLRRAKRPAMNPRQSKYVIGDTVYVNRSQVAPSLAKDLFWRVFIDPAVIRQISKDKTRVEIEFPFGKRYWFDVDAIEFKNASRERFPAVSTKVDCKTCHGTGLAPDYKSVCAVCHGGGKVRGNPDNLTIWTVRATTKAAALRGLAKSMQGTWYQVVSVKKKGPDTYLITIRTLEKRNPRRVPTRRNPAGKLQRLGHALEIRYRREIGRKPGYYKHEIESQRAGLYTVPAGWVYVPGKSILITEGKPHV